MRKKTNRFLFLGLTMLAVGSTVLTSCSEEETYAEQKERERNTVNSYISNAGIKVIDEATFEAQGYNTNAAENEFVLFRNTGVYMKIVNKGCGEKLKDGESANVLVRFREYNLNDPNTVSLENDGQFFYATTYDEMSVKKTSGTFTASFITSNVNPIMVQRYGSTSVPAGWLVPLSYINLGRPTAEGDKIAEVELIIPHSQGHAEASSQVNAFRYVMTFQRGI